MHHGGLRHPVRQAVCAFSVSLLLVLLSAPLGWMGEWGTGKLVRE